MSQLLSPPVPLHSSEIEGVTIEIKVFAQNIAHAGHGDHALEDWFWEITITNESNPFCGERGFWGLYLVRSRQPGDLQFRGCDSLEVIQLWPGDIPLQFKVTEESADPFPGVCMNTLFQRPGVGTYLLTTGLYKYNCA